jgi:hypothetical protein
MPFFSQQQFKVHWCILLQCPYFKALYDSGMQERTSGQSSFKYRDFRVGNVGRFVWFEI